MSNPSRIARRRRNNGFESLETRTFLDAAIPPMEPPGYPPIYMLPDVATTVLEPIVPPHPHASFDLVADITAPHYRPTGTVSFMTTGGPGGAFFGSATIINGRATLHAIADLDPTQNWSVIATYYSDNPNITGRASDPVPLTFGPDTPRSETTLTFDPLPHPLPNGAFTLTVHLTHTPGTPATGTVVFNHSPDPKTLILFHINDLTVYGELGRAELIGDTATINVPAGLLGNLPGGALKIADAFSWHLYADYGGDSSYLPSSTPNEILTFQPSAQEIYVTRLYHDLLHREPDAAGLAHWSGGLTQGSMSPSSVADGFLASPEYHTNLVRDLYQSAFQRSADPSGLDHWLTFLTNGHSLEELQGIFYGSDEFVALQGHNNQTLISTYYQTFLGRDADAAGLAYWTNRLNQGSDRAQLVYDLRTHTDEGAQFRVQTIYQTYLHRAATDDERALGLQELEAGDNEEYFIVSLVASSEYINQS